MKGFCACCNQEVELKVIMRNETYPVKGENIEISAQVCVCSKCGEELWSPVFDDNNLRNAYDKYRLNKGLLLPSEIKEIREKYGVSQTAFAKILGLGEKTIARYENGSIQDEAPNNLIRLAANENNFIELYEHNKGKLTAEEIRQVNKVLNKNKRVSGAYSYVYGQSSIRKDNILDFPSTKEMAV